MSTRLVATFKLPSKNMKSFSVEELKDIANEVYKLRDNHPRVVVRREGGWYSVYAPERFDDIIEDHLVAARDWVTENYGVTPRVVWEATS